MTNPRREKCRWHNPYFLAESLGKEWGTDGLIWLDGDGSKLGRWVTIGVDPVNQICCHGLPNKTIDPNPFEELRNINSGHWTGWLSYEAGAWIEPNNPWKPDKIATLWLGKHDPIFIFDLQKKELWLEGSNEKRFEEFLKYIDQLNTNKISRDHIVTKDLPEIDLNKWEWLTSSTQYATDVKKIQNLIKEGDIFQANLTACCKSILPKEITPLEIFKKLRNKCPAPFSGMVIGGGKAKGEAVLSASPELFLRASASGRIQTRPIKGTRPRGRNQHEDADLAADLICSGKDRAENIMIVDLLRNDLGRVCKPGSINVSQIVGLESYAQVHHLTSVIEGSLLPTRSWVDLLEACWPGGSISGAPKLRSCKRLFELEPVARGPYCGSFLRRNWDGSLDSNILIRSLILENRNIRAHAGCGIVADSDPLNEAEELQWKLLPLLRALQ